LSSQLQTGTNGSNAGIREQLVPIRLLEQEGSRLSTIPFEKSKRMLSNLPKVRIATKDDNKPFLYESDLVKMTDPKILPSIRFEEKYQVGVSQIGPV